MTERERLVAGADRVRAALTSIGAHARTANQGRADQLEAALEMLEGGGLSRSQRDVAVHSAHQLAGSAGTFGLAPASQAASWFERFFGAVDHPGPDELATARRQLIELRTRLDDPPDLD